MGNQLLYCRVKSYGHVTSVLNDGGWDSLQNVCFYTTVKWMTERIALDMRVVEKRYEDITFLILIYVYWYY